MNQEEQSNVRGTSRQAEEAFLEETLAVIRGNLEVYGEQVGRMREEIDDMLDHFHDDNPELINLLENSMTLYEQMKRALERNEKAQNKPYFGRIDFYDEMLEKDESIYIGKGGISRDTTHQAVVDWRAPVANAYYENGLGKCSYIAPGDKQIPIDLKLKRTYEIENGKLLDYYDSEVVANDELLTKYLAKNKQAVLGEIIATIQKEQNDIIRKSPYHNIIVQGVAGSGKTTVAMHRISFILYNYQERFKPDDFYIVGSNRILLNYITGVLPDLDVYGIRQMTMEQLFVRLLYEDWDEKKYRIKKSGQSGNSGSIRGTLGWFEDLKEYCDSLEWNGILRESIYLNPRQFVEGLRDGKSGVYDTTVGKKVNPYDLILLVNGEAVERYILQNPKVSMQSKINMLNERLIIKIKEEFLGKGVKYTEAEKKAILKAYRGRYGDRVWKGSIYQVYRDFLEGQIRRHNLVLDIPTSEFDVYDLAALAYIYKRIKETEVISEAHHIVIDEAQDYGMMAYSVLHFCIEACTYTIMGDVSQNIHFGFGLNDWEELRALLLTDKMDSFGILKKSYRNTVEISEFATKILHHGQFSSYPVEPIIRHGSPVRVELCASSRNTIIGKAAQVCREWQKSGYDTIAVVCRNQRSADLAAEALRQYIEVMENDLETAVFGNGIMVLPVEYTKGLEFDAVLILDPTREEYPVDDGHAKLLYVAATRALHELCVLHTGNLTGLIADPIPEKRKNAMESEEETGIVSPKQSPGKMPDISHSKNPGNVGNSPYEIKTPGNVGKMPYEVKMPDAEGKQPHETKVSGNAAGRQQPHETSIGENSRRTAAPGRNSGSEKNKRTIIAINQIGQSSDRQGQKYDRPSQKQKLPGQSINHMGQTDAPMASKGDQPGQYNFGDRKTASADRQPIPGMQPAIRKPRAVLPSASGTQKEPKVSSLTNLYSAKPVASSSVGSNTESLYPREQPPTKQPGSGDMPAFGDIPPTEKLRPMGHSKIDLSIRWVTKHPDGLCLQSRYGTLKLSPVGSAVMRVSFAKNAQPDSAVHPRIAVDRTEKFWMYRDTGSMVELTTDKLALQVDKTTGAIRYLAIDPDTGGKKLLLAERKKECRQLEARAKNSFQTWLFLDFSKEEHLYAFGPDDRAGIPLKGTARYISSQDCGALPLLLSDKGYGILPAAASPVFCCDIPAYGSYLHADSEKQMDYYFIYGKRKDTILNAYAYLSGMQ
ncbi:MAG TPA: DNA helicase UvrD [Lachnospiraceae bacterium]|nr:DNA helicase UvrD [Lachnospiraceae bacterium]